jgi:predicted outer membrane repeat protein
MKTHLINYIARIGLLMMVLTGGLKTGWGQWSGANYTTDQTINMTGDVTMTGVMYIDGCTVTIKPNGASRTINFGDPQAVFYFANGGVLKIEGTSSQTITIDCNNISNIFPVVYCDDAMEIDFDYVTIKNANGGSNGSAIYLRNGTANLNHCKFYDNSTTGEGGAIYLSNTSTLLNCTDCEFMRNSAGTEGGSIKTYTSVTLIDCIFTGNTANNGGALHMYSASANVNCNGCSFSNNLATNGGGAIYASVNPTLNLTDCTITGNRSNNNYGGVFNGCTSMTVSGLVVINGNTATNNYPNVYYAATKWIEIGADGLDCGSSIGVSTYQASNPYNIALVRGSAANCLDAYRNHYFFCDVLRYKSGSDYIIINGSEVDVLYSDDAPTYSSTSSGCLYFVNKTVSNGWLHYADASGCTISGGYVTQVNTAAGLAYLAKDIASGKNYSGKTVLLTADLNMAGHNWEPIGSACSDRAFCGNFNGQGHSISGLSSTLLYDNMGVFGYVGSGGTVKNLIVSNTISATSATNLGGIAGELDGGSVYNCISTVTLSGGTNRGALVGKVTSGSLLNSFAVSNDAVCGMGTATNCYVRLASGGSANNMGTATNTGASGNNTGAFSQTETPYLYHHNDNLRGSASLLSELNAWVAAQSVPADLARWTRTMASPINGDYPLLIMPGMKCVGTKSSSANTLNYNSSLNTMLGTHNASGDNIFFWGEETGVNTSNGSANVYFAEDASLVHTSTITNAHVGVTLDPANGSQGVHWHMFSPALSNAPLGLNYNNDNTDWPFSLTHPSGMPYYLFTQKSESNATYGYFPSHSYGQSYPANNNNLSDADNAGNYYTHWDFYTYYEPEYHWINFKRNGNSHHHEDEDPSHPHIDYHWDNNTSNSTSLNINEPTLVKGKGYLVATDNECLLEAKGTLNQGTFTIHVTAQSAYRTGYNLLGNPYQSQFDFDEFADVNKALWGGTKTNASYVILNKDGYTYYAYSGSSNAITSTANRYLHPHQGFMIFATNSGTASFTNEMRVTGQTTTFRGNDHVDYPLINLIVTEDDGNRDIATIELGRPETGGAIKQYDLHLGTGCIYSHYEDQDYAIAFTLPGISEVPVRFETGADAAYTLTWDMENGEFSYLHLIDNMTGSNIDCLQEREYRFTSKTTDYKSRFKLVFEYTGVEENEDGPSTGSGTFAFIMGNELVVNGGPSTGSGAAALQMFDMMGRQVMTKNVSGVQTTIMLPDVPAGVYILRMNDRVQKIIIE